MASLIPKRFQRLRRLPQANTLNPGKRTMKQVILILTASFVPCLPFALAADRPASPELGMAATALQPVLNRLDPKPTMEYPDHTASLVVTYLPQTYTIHGRSKTGDISVNIRDQVGPSSTGFVLRVHLQSKGEVNQASTPQTIQEPYWTTFLDVTPIEQTDKQIYWSLSYSSRTSTELLAQIRTALKQLEGNLSE